ncbi:MAG TPA: YdeI/OmpD-associated family protein [Phyllobacterium sp.]|nr:YdeI/OmpD-associated family protein [Phyllobacterium sp.]
MPDVKSGLPIMLFGSTAKFESWLAEQPRSSPGIWLKLAKKDSGIASVSQPEAIECALCHGWIDGQLDKFDEHHWLIRFTPRKPKGKWSERNRTKALELIDQGRIKASGLVEVERAKADGRWDAAYAPQSAATVPDDLQQALDAAPAALDLFNRLDSTNRYAVLYRIHTAAQAKTRANRIEKFVAMLARGETIYPLKPKPSK